MLVDGASQDFAEASRFEEPMRMMTVVGVLLIVLGLVALAYQGISYTTRETIIDVGPLEATAERERTVPLPPVLGVVAVVAGVGLLIAGRRRR